MACSAATSAHAKILGSAQGTWPITRYRTPLFRPSNPVTKFVRPHLSAGVDWDWKACYNQVRHQRYALFYKNRGPNQSNWLHHTAAPFHSEEYKLPELGSAELAYLRQTLAGKLARKASEPKPQPATADLTTTTNWAATYASSGSARTDLFFKVKEPGAYLPASTEDTTTQLLQQVGYWKDLLEILVRACVTAEQLQERKLLQVQTRNFMKWGAESNDKPDNLNMTELKAKHPEVTKMCKKEWRKHYRSLETEEAKKEARVERAKQTAEKERIISEYQLQQKQDKRKQASSNIAVKYADDKFRLLHLSVAVAFAEQLQKDMGAWEEGRTEDVSLAAKWAPTPKGSHDKDTFIACSIAQLLFANKEETQLNENQTFHYRVHQAASSKSSSDPVLTANSRYRELLVSLRKCLDVPEVYMCANEWQDVRYTRVPSVCMKNNKGSFEKHDEERFTQYLQDVKAGKKTIASGALKPHELVAEAMQHTWQASLNAEDIQQSSALSLDTMELQWKDYVTKLKESGTLSSAVAMADVSGSMYGEPMQVSIALSLLVAQVAGPPFHNTVLTFDNSPNLHSVQGATLVDQVKDLEAMEWGGSTDINAAFSLILQRACEAKIPQEQMIETLFIFSDMQFDLACYDYSSHSSNTNFEVAQADFEKHGYKLPKVVFWNLRGYGFGESASVPVSQTEEGTALVSGFSGQLLKLFMDGARELELFNPFNIMKEAIGKEKYNGWKVID